MSDFESRLGDALSSGAEGAPDASGLAAGARRRARRRRTAHAGVAAAVVLAVAVPTGVIALNDRGSDQGDLAKDPPAAPASDTRVETWHDISVEVPASWGYGARSSWCAGGKAESPVVERPGAIVSLIDCGIGSGFGVTFGSSAAISPAYDSGEVWQYEAGNIQEYLPGSWLGYWYDGNDLVEVNAGDKETVQEIIDSVERVDGADANGCPVVDDDGVADVGGDEVSVCRYSVSGDLVQSELLTGNDAVAASAAVEAAPRIDGANDCGTVEQEYVAMTVGSVRAEVHYENEQVCSGDGLFVGDEARELTSDVMYWALSPGWSGSVAPWVPLPGKLRALPTPEPTETAPTEAVQCPPDFPASSDGPGFEIQGVDTTAGPVLCRYELDWGAESGGSYVFDEQRTPSDDELDQLKQAVRSAPREFGGNDCRGGPGELYAVYAEGYSFSVYNAECGQSGVLASEEDLAYRDVTAEVLDLLGSPYGLLR